MLLRALPLLASGILLLAAPALAHETPGHLVVNGDVTGVLKGRDRERQFGGRMNAYLTLSGELERGARIEALNVALFGVDQALISGQRGRGKPTGVVGFSATAKGEDRQQLEYDSRSRALVGQIRGRLDMPQLYHMAELRIDPKADYVELPRIDATLQVRIALGKLGEISPARGEAAEAAIEAGLDLSISDAGELELVDELQIAVTAPYLEAQLVWWPWIEIASRLCIQPVRIFTFQPAFPFPIFRLSGDGLAFGQPGAKTQWDKADVVFTYRDWITLFDAKYSTLSGAEAGDLLDEVDVDDCIEVFFVDAFDPQDMWGGGAAFGLGVASSKVISTDENADFGVDLTHLAHELGHVLALGHPPGNSSTNTLMCPSGFNNDNPKRNSQENKDNLSNPLLTFAIKFVSPGPDCVNSADCGPCPPIP